MLCDALVRNLVAEETVSATDEAADLVGFLADEPELVDRIMDDVYRTREGQSLRTPTNGSSDT